MIELYQFYFSHYCEKARWALDYKGLAYEPRNLLPGLHAKPAKKLAASTALPIIVDDGTVVQDSTAIIEYLDRKYPHQPLMPRDPTQAREAMEWEEYLDEEIGVTLRLWFYFHLLPDRRRTLKFMLDGAPWYGRPLLTVMFPAIRNVMRKSMNINAETARQSELRLLEAFERLDARLKNNRYLVGEHFSRADLTACALLSPYCLPQDAQAARVFPDAARALRDAHKSRPFFTWVRSMYAEHRGRNPDRDAAR